MLYGFVLLLVLMALTVWGIGRMKAGRKAVAATAQKSGQQTEEYAAAQENSNRQADAFRESFWEARRVFWIPAAAVLGYFLVVTKTALLTAEEANRYQIPVYGLILLLMMVIFVLLGQKLFVLTMRKGTAVKSAAGKISDTRDTSAPENGPCTIKQPAMCFWRYFWCWQQDRFEGWRMERCCFFMKRTQKHRICAGA